MHVHYVMCVISYIYGIYDRLCEEEDLSEKENFHSLVLFLCHLTSDSMAWLLGKPTCTTPRASLLQ